MSAAALAAIIIIAVIPTVVAMALSMPPRQPDPAASRTSAVIGVGGWHGCHIDAAGRTVWTDPVARPSAAEAADTDVRAGEDVVPVRARERPTAWDDRSRRWPRWW